MANVMLVDVVRYKWFIVLAGIVGTILLSAVLLGALGPKTYDQHSKSAYNCVNGSHTYVPVLCPGVQLGQPNQTWTYELPELSTLNGFWSLTMFPFNLQYNKTGLVEDLKVAVTVQGLKNNEWKNIVENKVETEILLCDLGEPECWAFVLVYEDTVKYSRYQVSVSLPDTDNPGKQYVGDVEFRFSWYNVPFVEEQLALRVFFLVMATVCIFLFWLRMRATEIDQWSLEQKFMALLLLSLVALNNPFYPFEYLVAGWFFPTLDCLLQVIHLGVLQIFWLVMFDHVRRGDETLQFRKVDIIKPVCVGLYCALTLALFIWFRISHDIDPLFGQTKSINGMVVLFLACVLLFFGMMIWILVALMFAIPTVRQKRVLVARFMMLAIPTLIVLFSVVIGLFFGNFGPVRRSALSFVYYFTMYNVYVWVLLVAYWPVKSTFSLGISNPTEATPIFKDEKPSAVFETSEPPSYDRL